MHTIMHILSINIRFLCKHSRCCDSRTVRALGFSQECQYVHAFEYRQGLLFDCIVLTFLLQLPTLMGNTNLTRFSCECKKIEKNNTTKQEPKEK